MSASASGGLIVALLAARVLLAAVFAVSGWGKLRDPIGTAGMLREFGVPPALARASAHLLPAIELALGACLLPSFTAPFAAAGALALLVLFTAAVAYNLARGRRPECRCFGSGSASPIGTATIARNVVLTGATAFVTFEPSSPSYAAVAALAIAHPAAAALTLLAAALVMQVMLSWQIVAQQGRILMRLEAIEGSRAPAAAPDVMSQAGLEIGLTAPEFSLTQLDGSTGTLAALLAAGRPTLIFFLSASCGPCHALIPQIVRWQSAYDRKLTVAIVAEGSASENRRIFREYAEPRVFLQQNREVAEAYRAHGTPAAVLIAPNGTIRSYVAIGADAIASLVATSVYGLPSAPSRNGHAKVAVGEPAPHFSLETANGVPVTLDDLRARDFAMLFWNPDCGFCRQAAESIVRWERDSRLHLLVVSSAHDPELAERGLRAPILIDRDSRIRNLFGIHGTPMALYINDEGIVASETAAGREAILSLLDRHDGLLTR